MTVHTRSRSRAVSAFVVIVMCLGVTYGCDDVRRQSGDDCIKNEDCVTNICSQAKCSAAPPILKGTPSGDGGTEASTQDSGGGNDAAGGDSASDGAADSSDDGPPEDAADDVTVNDASPDTSVPDASVDAADAAIELDGSAPDSGIADAVGE